MKCARLWLLGLTLILATGIQPAQAAGWSWRNWVPFTGSGQTTRTPMLDGRPLVRSNKPSPFRQMTNGTKRMFRSATNTLTFNRQPQQPKPVSGYSGRYEFRKSKPQEKPGWFSGWFASEEPAQPETPQEWLSQERPMP